MITRVMYDKTAYFFVIINISNIKDMIEKKEKKKVEQIISTQSIYLISHANFVYSAWLFQLFAMQINCEK